MNGSGSGGCLTGGEGSRARTKCRGRRAREVRGDVGGREVSATCGSDKRRWGGGDLGGRGKEGEGVDHQRLNQVGRALRELGVRMIPAYSPQARGRSERNFGNWQGRLPQELRLRGIRTVEAANAFLREHYI